MNGFESGEVFMNACLWKHFDCHNDNDDDDDDDDDYDGGDDTDDTDNVTVGNLTFDPCGPGFESGGAAAIVPAAQLGGMVSALLHFGDPLVGVAADVPAAKIAYIVNCQLPAAIALLDTVAAYDPALCNKDVALQAAMEYLESIVNPDMALLSGGVADVWYALCAHQLRARQRSL